MSEKQHKQQRQHKQREKRILHIAITTLFIAVISVVFIVQTVKPDKEYSETENRMLAGKPEVTSSGVTSGRFMKQYETYKSDQFIGRDFWMQLKIRTDKLMGKKESNGVFQGKKHYLLEDIKSPDAAVQDETLTAMKNFQAKHSDLPMYMALIPNAANILKDKLPALAVVADQNAMIQKVQETLGSGIQWIDAGKPLRAHKDEAIYYHTDHHWTTLGANYVFQEAMIDAMQLPSEYEVEMTPLAVTDSFNGTLSATSGYETKYKEPIYAYFPKGEDQQVIVNYVESQKKTTTLYNSAKLKEKDKYAVFLGGNEPLIEIQTTSKRRERLLVFKDSYANCLIPFLTPYYRNIIMVDPRYYYGDIEELISGKGITEVLFLYNANTFFEDNSLSGVLESE